MNWKRLIPLGSLMLLITIPLYAQTPPGLPTDRPITLQECIEYALIHHNDMIAARNDLANSRANLRKAQSGFLPQITASGSHTMSGYREAGESITSESTDNQAQISVRETIWDGGRTQTTIRQASASKRAVYADFDRITQERILTVTVAYFDMLKAKRLADIAYQSVEEAYGQRELIQARIDTGDAAKVDIYPVEVQLANARLQKLQADNTARVSMTTLINAIGLTEHQELFLADVEQPSWEIQQLDEYLRSAFQERPELIRSNAQIDSSKWALLLAKLQRFPVPTASVNYDRGLTGLSYDSQWSIGLGVSLIIFDGGSAEADEQIARNNLDSAKLNLAQLKIDISKEVEEAYLNLKNALERLEASKSNVELARINLEVANEKYKQGLAIPLEVVSAQVSNADAQASYAQALYDCYVTRARLYKAMGRGDY